ncbi:DUF1272 domain-containing protein [Cupriavidus sp. CuC1]
MPYSRRENMLDLRPSCEHCNKALPPASLEARICSCQLPRPKGRSL